MKKENIRKITDFGKNEGNPFLSKESIGGGDKGHFTGNQKHEERQGSIIRKYEEAFSKLYPGKPARFFSLSQATVRVFAHVSTRLKKDEDFVLFNRKERLKYASYKTDRPVRRGVAECAMQESPRGDTPRPCGSSIPE